MRMRISRRLEIEGPDSDGEYGLILDDCHNLTEYTYLNAKQAAKLREALAPAYSGWGDAPDVSPAPAQEPEQ